MEFKRNTTTSRVILEGCYTIGYTIVVGAIFLLIASICFYAISAYFENVEKVTGYFMYMGLPETLSILLMASVTALILFSLFAIVAITGWLTLPRIFGIWDAYITGD